VRPPDPNILYSANSLLAYRIGKKFYGDLHYVWCSTRFGSGLILDSLERNPATSIPYGRYKGLSDHTERVPDLHSDLVAGQKAGIKAGAQAKFATHIITEADRDEILAIVDMAQPVDFQPLMYVIPWERVKAMAQKAPVNKRAHPLSDEWIIEALPGEMFDIIRF
jgi:hypothetical protein